MSSVYEHRYEPVSIYGNAVSLLRECGGRSGVHLDFGCGYGAIAEPIRDELGLAYLGFDIASDGLDSLRRRGFEAHRIDLYDLDQAETLAERAIGNRPIASMTCLDTLEHITNGEEVLKLLRRIAELADAPLVLSVPNVTHKDLALKLLIGRWDVTEAGLLDHTHVTLYSHARLSRLMMAVGWRQTAARDWLLQHSDQEFPASAAVLNHRLPIGHFLLDFINRANPHAIVNQFVRAYRVAPAQPQPLLESRDEAAAPFLSVVLTACEDTVAGDPGRPREAKPSGFRARHRISLDRGCGRGAGRPARPAAAILMRSRASCTGEPCCARRSAQRRGGALRRTIFRNPGRCGHARPKLDSLSGRPRS